MTSLKTFSLLLCAFGLASAGCIITSSDDVGTLGGNSGTGGSTSNGTGGGATGGSTTNGTGGGGGGVACVTCSEAVQTGGVPCDGTSTDLALAFEDCACTGSCAAVCGDNFCAEAAETAECTACLEDTVSGCGNELTACLAD